MESSRENQRVYVTNLPPGECFGLLDDYVGMVSMWSEPFVLLSYPTQDQQSTKANTLSDDADDLQKQLDNEARDRLKFGQPPKAIWIFRFPTHNHGISTTESIKSSKDFLKRVPCNISQSTESETFIVFKRQTYKDWSYKEQNNWGSLFPACGGYSQSPINLPVQGMIRVRATRKLFLMYDKPPRSMTVVNDAKTISLFGEWDKASRPIIYGGAAHSRRYVFHSLALRFPSEHTVGGLTYPMETQALHISVEYATFNDAINAASRDKLAFLVVANIYTISDHTHAGLEELIKSAMIANYVNTTIEARPMNFFIPVLKEYAAYHGSLTVPPCTESALWLVRARSLPVTRELVESFEKRILEQNCEPSQSYNRLVQPLHDRKLFFFQ